MIFEKRYEIRYSELDSRLNGGGSFIGRHASLPAIITFWQDTGMAQTAMLESDPLTKAANTAYVWFLLSWRVEVYRYPAYGETVVSRTWATGFDGVYGYRDYTLLSEDGELLAAASTVWASLDSGTGKLKRCSKEVADSYGICEDRAFEGAAGSASAESNASAEVWKMRIGKNRSRIAEVEVRRSDIDSNVHVNNVNYIRMALDAYAGAGDIHSLTVNYKKAAVFGDVICIETDEDGAYVLCGREGDVFAAVKVG